MIPKILHYCWFGRGQMGPVALKCMESWKKYCPDYQIKVWNEDNFDIGQNTFVKEAYEEKNGPLLQITCGYMHCILKAEFIWTLILNC